MKFDNLRQLLQKNEAAIQELEQAHAAIISSGTEAARALFDAAVRLDNQQYLDKIAGMITTLQQYHGKTGEKIALAAAGVSWDNLEKEFQSLRAHVEQKGQEFYIALGTPGKKDLATTAFAFHQALLTLNTAIPNGIQYLVTKEDNKQDRHKYLFGLISQVKESTAQLSTSLKRLADLAAQAAAPSTHVSLKREIDHLSNRYADDYKIKYGVGFWRKIKEFFRNSDRLAEIGFLKAISDAPQCTDEMRLHAINLVNDKIANQEFFGGGSLLRERLSAVIKNTAVVIQPNTHNNLTNFCETNVIAMPKKLHAFLEKHAAEYTTEALHKVL